MKTRFWLLMMMFLALTACGKSGGGGGSAGETCTGYGCTGSVGDAGYVGAGVWKGYLVVTSQTAYQNALQLMQPKYCIWTPCYPPVDFARLGVRLRQGFLPAPGEFRLQSMGYNGMRLGRISLTGTAGALSNGFVITYRRYRNDYHKQPMAMTPNGGGGFSAGYNGTNGGFSAGYNGTNGGFSFGYNGTNGGFSFGYNGTNGGFSAGYNGPNAGYPGYPKDPGIPNYPNNGLDSAESVQIVATFADAQRNRLFVRLMYNNMVAAEGQLMGQSFYSTQGAQGGYYNEHYSGGQYGGGGYYPQGQKPRGNDTLDND